MNIASHNNKHKLYLHCSPALEIILQVDYLDYLFLGESRLSVYEKEPAQKAQACVIWMHGLGADANDMMGLAEQLTLVGVALKHVFIDAPKRPVTLNGGLIMPAWYDILGLELKHREDKEGIEHSEGLIKAVIETQKEAGFDSSQIFLAGFSQGGAMAIHTALTHSEKLAGVVALSAYIPMISSKKPIQAKSTPFFMASGQFDPLVLPQWTEQSRDWLLTHGYEYIAYHQYPMEHSICFEEIKDLSIWFSRQFQGELQ